MIDTIASACARTVPSSMVHPNVFHEFQPIGGVCARRGRGGGKVVCRCCAFAAAGIESSATRAATTTGAAVAAALLVIMRLQMRSDRLRMRRCGEHA